MLVKTVANHPVQNDNKKNRKSFIQTRFHAGDEKSLEHLSNSNFM